MLNLIGPYAIKFDALLTAVLDKMTSAVSVTVAGPMMILLCAYYAQLGFKAANGDREVLVGFIPNMFRNLVIIVLATNMTTYNYYVRDWLATGVGDQLSNAVSSASGTTNAGDSLSNVTVSYTNMFGHMWFIISMLWESAGGWMAQAGVIIVGFFAGLFALLSILVVIVVYVIARFMVNILICLGPGLILLGLFPATRPFLDRAVGKLVAVVLTKVVAFMLVGITIQLSNEFMNEAHSDVLTMMTNGTQTPQIVAAITVCISLFVMNAILVAVIPVRIGYSIGSGSALTGSSLMGMAMVAKQLGGGGKGGGGGEKKDNGGKPSSGSGPNYNLGVNRPGISGSQKAISGRQSLPPPSAPPALTHSKGD